MKKHLRTISFLLAFIFIFASCTSNVTIDDDNIPTSSGSEIFYALPGPNDIIVIPDKYNTGIDESQLLPISSAGTYDGVYYKMASGGTRLALDLYYNNKNLTDIVIENKDFSSHPFISLNESNVSTKKTITFKNCKFSFIKTARNNSNVTYIFEGCSISSFNGSNSTFYNSYFGGTLNDGLNPHRNVTLKNCFISDLAHKSSTPGILHSDGTQIFGERNSDSTNIYYDNVRMEIPPFHSQTTQVYTSTHV